MYCMTSDTDLVKYVKVSKLLEYRSKVRVNNRQPILDLIEWACAIFGIKRNVYILK